MKQILLIIITFVCIVSNSFGQTDSLKNEILNYDDSTTMTINKGRKLLLDNFLKNDKVKVQKLLFYLTKNIENEDYLALYPIENGLINYWLGQYSLIDSNSLLYSNEYFKNNDKKLKPRHDLLFDKIKTYMKVHEEEQINQIEIANLTEENKMFLKINLTFFLSNFNRNEPFQDTLNNLTTNFLTKYPNSKYGSYIKEQIRWAFKPKNFGYGLDFFTGYGVFTKTLSNQFQNNIPLGVGFEFSFKRVALYLRDYIGYSHTKQDLTFPSATWSNGKEARVYLPELSVGYLLTSSDKIKLIPFLGISSTDISPTSQDQKNIQGYSDIGWKFTTTYTVGLNVDMRISKLLITSLKNGGIEKGFYLLKFRYAYNAPQFQKKYAGLDGSMHYLTVGIGLYGKRYKRD